MLFAILWLASGAWAQTPPASVTYYGGPVVSNARVYVVFWGSGFSTQLQNQLPAFYSAIVNSTYIDQLAEYDTDVTAANGQPGTGQKIGRGTFGQVITIQPVHTGTQLTTDDLEAEFDDQIKAGVLPVPDANAVYMLHFPAGISITISWGLSCSDWYADHEVYTSPTYGAIRYGMFPCDSADTSNFDNLTSAASHELAETITDPDAPIANQAIAYPAAWLRSDGQEIADLCTATAATLTSGTTSYAVQGVWLNSLGNCNPQATFTSGN